MLFVFLCLCFFISSTTSSLSSYRDCRTPPTPSHGRVRTDDRGLSSRHRVARYRCARGYTLIGDKVATCFRGNWDTRPPVCVRAGCTLTSLENGDTFSTHRGAFLRFFCNPGYDLVGASSLYCDGRKWNDTVPTCVKNEHEHPQLSCDFEVDLCGWSQSPNNDFDWTRWSKKTPSNFLSTGPSYDHTLGEGKNGYYMYIETTGKQTNDSAFLISPVYSSELTKDGCFSVFYHMYGRHTGGLRIYQRAEGESMKEPIFEVWHEQGDEWHRAVVPLNEFTTNFEIVVEGVCGTSYQSDIAIDDVAILNGENCTQLMPEVPIGTCQGRCDNFWNSEPDDDVTMTADCHCNINCIGTEECCRDFYICIDMEKDPFADTTDIAPRSERLYFSLAEASPSTKLTTARRESTTITSRTLVPTILPTTTTEKPIATTKTVKRTLKIKAPEATTVKQTTRKLTTFKPTTNKPATNKPTSIKVTTIKPTTTKRTTVKPSTTTPRGVSLKESLDEYLKSIDTKVDKVGGSKAGTVVLSILGILFCAAIVCTVYVSRTVRGRVLIARIRGRASSDPEVRYLNTEEDHDD